MWQKLEQMRLRQKLQHKRQKLHQMRQKLQQMRLRPKLRQALHQKLRLAVLLIPS